MKKRRLLSFTRSGAERNERRMQQERWRIRARRNTQYTEESAGARTRRSDLPQSQEGKEAGGDPGRVTLDDPTRAGYQWSTGTRFEGPVFTSQLKVKKSNLGSKNYLR
jgi:hypothetical protein